MGILLMISVMIQMIDVLWSSNEIQRAFWERSTLTLFNSSHLSNRIVQFLSCNQCSRSLSCSNSIQLKSSLDSSTSISSDSNLESHQVSTVRCDSISTVGSGWHFVTRFLNILPEYSTGFSRILMRSYMIVLKSNRSLQDSLPYDCWINSPGNTWLKLFSWHKWINLLHIVRPRYFQWQFYWNVRRK